MSALTEVANEHRDRLMAHVEALPALADEIGTAPGEDVARRVGEEHEFLLNALIPHMASVEATLYPELDKLLSCRLAMTPMAREHEQIRELVIALGAVRDEVAGTPGGTAYARELSRILHRLHDILEPHLREESHYVPLLEHNLGSAHATTLAAAVDHPIRQPAAAGDHA